jgi:hypothetical protein
MGAICTGIQVVTGLTGAIKQKNASDKAAEKAQAAANFNAEMIERDIGLLEKQRGIINAQFAIDQVRDRRAFEREIQSTARAGFDMSRGTPLAVLRINAREFDYQAAVNEFNNEMTNMQISDEQENARLNAELARMEGSGAAASLRAQGTASLISGLGQVAGLGYQRRIFGSSPQYSTRASGSNFTTSLRPMPRPLLR